MTYITSSTRKQRAIGRQRGNALLYTLLALVLGGIGLAVGVGQYQDAERATSVQATVGEVNAIIGAAKQNFGQYSYAGLNTAAAIGSQVIPAGMVNGAVATNKFGGAVDMAVSVAHPNNAELTYAQVPSSVCLNIVNGTHSMAREVRVEGTIVKGFTEAIPQMAALTAACAPAGGTGNVAITWVIGRT